jgi:hypothetical protein
MTENIRNWIKGFIDMLSNLTLPTSIFELTLMPCFTLYFLLVL